MARSIEDICNLALLNAGVNQKISNIGALNNPAAQACSIVVDEYRRQILNEFRWKFAVQRQVLAALAGNAYDASHTYGLAETVKFGRNLFKSLQAANLNNQPDQLASAAWWVQVTRDGYLYVCPLPDDCLDPIAVWPREGSNDPFFFGANVRNPRSDERIPFTVENSNDGTDLQVLLTDVSSPVLKYVKDVMNPSAYPSQFVEVYAWKMGEALARSLRGDEKKAESCAKRYQIELGSSFNSDMRDEQEDEEPMSEFEAARLGLI